MRLGTQTSYVGAAGLFDAAAVHGATAFPRRHGQRLHELGIGLVRGLGGGFHEGRVTC